MSAIKTMDLVLIQDPNHIPQGLLTYDRDQEDHPSGYLKDLLRYYREGIPVKDIAEFCGRIFAEVSLRKRLVKNLIVGSHGAHTGGKNGVGFSRPHLIFQFPRWSQEVGAPFRKSTVRVIACFAAAATACASLPCNDVT